MMSSHINSMLEHLRIKKPSRPAAPPVVTSPEEDTEAATAAAAATAIAAAAAGNNATSNGRATGGCPFLPNGNGAVPVSANKSTADVCDNAVTSPASMSTSTAIDAGKRLSARPDITPFDPKKRFSIPAVTAPSDATNGDHGGVQPQQPRPRRDLSPSAGGRHMARKMSQDMRMLPRGSYANLSDEAFELARIRRPVKVKSIITNVETYDSLHAKATEVSVPLCSMRAACVPAKGAKMVIGRARGAGRRT